MPLVEKDRFFYSLSNEDIQKILPNCNILVYSDLKNYRRLDDIRLPCVILFRTSPTYGHWTCLFRNKLGEIEFFDSYGKFPDDELEFIDEETKKELNESFPYLLNLMKDYSNHINFNNYWLQGKGVCTCGRHCVLRMLLNDDYEDIDDYVDNVFYKYRKIGNPDEIVTFLTDELL